MALDTPPILTDLMNSLQRFFKVGLYYPEGHSVANQAAAACIHALNKVADKETSHIRFGVSGTTLSLQGFALDNSLFAVQYFHDLLHSLSISTLDIQADITADELRLFFSRLLFLQTKVRSSTDFQQIEITGLPSTIKVHQLNFLVSETSAEIESPGYSFQPTIDYLLSTFVENGLNQEQVSMCRQLLESIPDALRKRQLAETDLPSVTWDDVEKLLRSVVESNQYPDQDNNVLLVTKAQNIDALVAILKSIEGAIGGTKSRDAVNLLVETLKGSPPQTSGGEPEKSEPMRRNDPPAMTLDELRLALEPLAQRLLPADLGENNRSEELSILMQMVGQEHRLSLTTRTQEVLSTCLRGPLEKKEWRVVIRGMQQVLKTQDPERGEATLLMILKILRSSAHTTPLNFLRDFCQGFTKAEFLTCWPYLVNEAFLAGPHDEPEVFQEICTIIDLLPDQEMHSNLARIERLDALSGKRIAASTFSPPPSSLKALLLLLLNSAQATYIYGQLVLGLRRSPLGWLDKAVAPLLDPSLPAHQQFIVDLLKEKDPEQPSLALKKMGTTIIFQSLPTLPAESTAVIVGMQHLLKTLDPERVEAALVMILDTLHRSAHTTPLSFLRDFCQGLTKPEFLTCWPLLINEAFLAGPEDEPEVFQEICSLIALLPGQEMHRHLHRIEQLVALTEKRIAPSLFSPPPASLNALLLLLLNSSLATYIYAQLVPGLRRHPLGWLDKAVAPLLDKSLPSHQQFIFALLKEKDPQQPSPGLKKIGASIIIDKLSTIPVEQRNAEWVVDAIAVLAKVQVPGGRDMLDTILSSRHWLIIPDWPRATRKAAREALREMF